MHLMNLGKALLRRWYLFVVVLALSAGATWAIASRLPDTYRASASIVLIPPDTTLGDTGNPYLFLGGLQQSVDVLTRDLGSEQIRSAMKKKAGSSATYEVSADFATSAPIVVVTTEASTATAAQGMLDAVVAQVPVSLAGLQTALSVTGNAQITTQLISQSEKPEAIMSSKYRALVVVAGGLAVLGILLVGMIDGLLLRRRQRKLAVSEPAEVLDDSEDEDEDEVLTEPASLDKRRKTGAKTGTDG